MVRVDRPTRRPVDPPTDGVRRLSLVEPSTDSGEWQREGEPRWYESVPTRPFLSLDFCDRSVLWHQGEIEARHQIANGYVEWYDALREAIIERESIEAEVDALVGDHSDVDALASNLPVLRVPDESRTFARLAWLVRRWWTRIVEQRRASRERRREDWGRSPGVDS